MSREKTAAIDLAVLPLPVAVAVTCAVELGAEIDRGLSVTDSVGWRLAVLADGEAAQDALSGAGFYTQPHRSRAVRWWLHSHDVAAGYPATGESCRRCRTGRVCVIDDDAGGWICLACWRAASEPAR